MLRRWFYTATGITAVILGVAGIILPLLPTTPFLLLASFCFAKSSQRCHQWLLNHPWFGHYLQDYQSGAGLSRQAKCTMLAFMWISIGVTVVLWVPVVWVKGLLLIAPIWVTFYLCRLPTKPVPANHTSPVKM